MKIENLRRKNMADLSGVTNALISGDTQTVCSLVQNEVEKGTPAGEILNIGLIQGMDIIGEKMQSGDMFIPEVLKSAKSMSEAVEILKPLLSEEEMSTAGYIVIGTVKGDLHDIGKNLVSMMIESSGFGVTDLGVDVAPDAFVKAVQEKNATV